MNRIVYVWELGGGYGHTAAFLPAAQQLKQHGHEVIFVLKDLQYADTLLGDDDFCYLQAPIRWPTSQTLPLAISYSDILQNAGFDQVQGLYTKVKAWINLFQHLAPDLIVLDHAPSAILATRQLDIPRALFGTGFFSPPKLNPLPAIRPWQTVAEKQLVAVEAKMLAAINSVLHRLGAQPLNMMADLFDTDEDFLCTFPELDHYQQRGEAKYWGPAIYQASGIDPIWPSVGTQKIFGYLRQEYPGLEGLLQQLRSSSWSVLIHIPGTTPAFIEKHSSANLHISAQPLNITAASRGCDLGISYGGPATMAAFLLSGKPVLALPMHLEQLVGARNIADLGAGICVPMESKKTNYRALITELLSNGKYAKAAHAFAEKYASFSPAQQAIAISQRCEALINQTHINGKI